MGEFITEREGQLDFYNRFLPRVNPSLSIDDILADNNDGVLNGNLLEFKLNISDINAVLFQCVKYLSALRVKGKPVPAGIHIIDLNAETVYYFLSSPYLACIEKLYTGGASKDNSGFIGGSAVHTLHYGSNDLEAETLITLLKENHYTKINIDENCIVGWATSFYSASPMSRKEDFLGDDTGKHKTIGEIRKPSRFKEYIYPYTGETNVKFNYLMDKLNDTLQKKNLGAFYTPTLYAQKSIELVRQAIRRVPSGNDYIILDRCAGTGNLEAGLTEEELSHCIVSTVEYYEYKVLQELIGSKVRHIIPPVEKADTFNAGLVSGADALSKEYLDNHVIKQYLDNPACSIILFENPPYAEPQARTINTKATWKNSYVLEEMRKEVKGPASNDLGNAFIWSGFKYYLRQPTDSYVVYSPVKYWKAQQLVNKQFIKGFAFNRRWFHTNIDACIMCALWANIDATIEAFDIEGFNYEPSTNSLINAGMLSVKRVYQPFSSVFYEKRDFPDDTADGIAITFDGVEVLEGEKALSITKKYNQNILGYMRVGGFNFDNPDLESSLLVSGCYNGHGFFVRKDNYLEKIPMFCASRYITYNREWTERARIMKSADGSTAFYRDIQNGKLKQFLLKCLLFTCLEMQNHMRTLTGSDGRFYRNELALDGTNGDTIAINDLRSLTKGEKEQALLKQWETLLSYAKQTEEYNPAMTYGVYQIFAEIDTSYTDETTGKTIYNNVEVHSALSALKTLVKEYYNTEIVPTLFEYEFLK